MSSCLLCFPPCISACCCVHPLSPSAPLHNPLFPPFTFILSPPAAVHAPYSVSAANHQMFALPTLPCVSLRLPPLQSPETPLPSTTLRWTHVTSPLIHALSWPHAYTLSPRCSRPGPLPSGPCLPPSCCLAPNRLLPARQPGSGSWPPELRQLRPVEQISEVAGTLSR